MKNSNKGLVFCRIASLLVSILSSINILLIFLDLIIFPGLQPSYRADSAGSPLMLVSFSLLIILPPVLLLFIISLLFKKRLIAKASLKEREGAKKLTQLSLYLLLIFITALVFDLLRWGVDFDRIFYPQREEIRMMEWWEKEKLKVKKETSK